MASLGIRCAGCACEARCECLSRERLLADSAALIARAAASRGRAPRKDFDALAARFVQAEIEDAELRRACRWLRRTFGRGPSRVLSRMLFDGDLESIRSYVYDVYLKRVTDEHLEAARAYVAQRWLRPRVTRPRPSPASRRSQGRKPKIRCRPARRVRAAAPARKEVR